MSDHINHSEYDAIGELFRRKLENHRMPVDDSDWDEIERRMGKRKRNKVAIWLSVGVMAAAASIAALVIFSGPAADEIPVMTLSQQTIPEEPATTLETLSVPASDEVDAPPVDVPKPADKPAPNKTPATLPGTDRTSNEAGFTDFPGSGEPGDRVSATVDRDGLPVAAAEAGREQPGEDEPVVAQAEKEIPRLDISLVEDKPDEETDTKKKKKWLLAVAFGTGGYTDGLSDTEDAYYASMDAPEWDGLGSGNQYATDLSGSIRSFSNMARDDFSSISHHTPLSFGLTVRKSLGKHAGIESGLVYTYLSSRFKWDDYDVYQSLHYTGIPVNIVVYLWQAKPNWRIYLSGGFTVEKGLRAVYRQERRLGNEIRTTSVRTSIDGLQWSLNGGLGINYRFGSGLGIYFEPRAGYAFDCGQPINMRTEWPIFVGINMGLNYEL
ncbi:MAG: hypothetical protein LBL24_02825 [Bacteroidales bacterium]|nr:hypothetical protein [Bacteroidales bacterium]